MVLATVAREIFSIMIQPEYLALLVGVVVHLFVVFVEEPSLRRQFGASYETYLRTVSRWLPLR